MEEVWRSYGPLEPIGPDAERAGRRRRRGAIAAGVIGVCTVGAAAGLYLKPNIEQSGPKTAERAEPAGTEPPDRLAEAQALQDELRVAVADLSRSPSTVTGPAGGPTTASPPAASYLPPAAPYAPAAPAYAPRPEREPPSFQERAGAVYRAVVAPRAEPRVEPPSTRAVRPPPVATAPPPAPPSMAAQYERTPPRYVPPPPRYVPPPPRREIAPEAAAPPPPVIAPPPPPRGPSFDCRTVRSAAEDMICADPRLADLDRQMAAELMGAMAAGHNPDLLLRDQNDWLGRRDRAAPDPRAVADAYQRRIGQLRSMQ